MVTASGDLERNWVIKILSLRWDETVTLEAAKAKRWPLSNQEGSIARCWICYHPGLLSVNFEKYNVCCLDFPVCGNLFQRPKPSKKKNLRKTTWTFLLPTTQTPHWIFIVWRELWDVYCLHLHTQNWTQQMVYLGFFKISQGWSCTPLILCKQ